MKIKKIKYIVLLVCSTFLLVMFQNCSEVSTSSEFGGFSQDFENLNSQIINDSDFEYGGLVI